MISRTDPISAALGALVWLIATAAAAQQPPPQRADEAMQGGGVTEERQLADEQARLRFRAGLGLYDAGQFRQAAEEFEAAYRLSQRPQLLFNAYVAYRDASDLAGAVRSLEGYLREMEEEVLDRVNLEARLVSMRETLAEQQAREAALEQNRRRIAELRSQQRPEVWPWVVAATGGAMVIAGAITGGLALSEADALVAACPGGQCGAAADLANRRSTAQALAITTDVLLFGGAAVAVTGVVLGLVLSGGSASAANDDAPEVSGGCDGTACGGSVRVRF